MIFTGQKIVTLISSNNKTGTHIRRGSLGYVSLLGKPSFYHVINALLVPAKIVFTRFGFEKKRRSETKIVFLMFPIAKAAGVKNIRKYLNKKINKAVSMHSILKRRLRDEGVKSNKFEVLVATHTNLESSIINSENEFEAWLSSVIQSGIFHKLLTLNNLDEIKKARNELVLGLPEVEVSLKKCVLHNGEIGKLVHYFQSRPEERLETIKQFKQYLHLDMRRLTEKAMGNMNKNYIGIADKYALYWFFHGNNIKLPQKIIDSYQYVSLTDHINFWMTKFETLNDA